MDPEAGQEPPSKKAKLENDGAHEGHDHALPVAPIDASGAAVPNGSAPTNANGDTQKPGVPSEAPPNDAATQPPAAGGNNPLQAPPATTTKETPATKPEPVTATATPHAIPLDTYCTREIRHIDRETSGELKAYYVQNDGQPDSGRFLIGLKNIFSKCLPNMPKTYITRLVFDRRHRSVVIVRNGNKVIGGITYRPFHERRFAEIAFCAIAQTLQVSGFGTRLMNWTKKFARDHDACEYFLTYADNNAVGYFSKQGFTKTLTMPRERWHGYIKDYDGGTLMECFIHPTLPFTDLPGAIAKQRVALESAVQQYTTAHVVQPGLTRWKAGGEGGQIPLGDIPGVKEAGWTEATAAAAVPRCQLVVGGKLQAMTSESLKALQTQLLDQLVAETDLVWPYLNPVPREEVPDYYDVIKNPIDISTIRKRLEQGGFYVTLDIFVADVLRMFTNAKEYNAQETLFYKSAHKLSNMFQQWVNAAVHYSA
jgi:histone acetyltransferase